jgi:hypothetical protein
MCACEHHTDRRNCLVEGCLAGKGRACAHIVAKCVNHRGPHSHTRTCARGRGRPSWRPRGEVCRLHRHVAGGMPGSPQPTSPPQGEASGERDEIEVEQEHSSAPEAADGIEQ